MKKSLVLIAAAVLLAGCGGSTSSKATPSAVPSQSPQSASTSSAAPTTGGAPTAEQTAWAGQVCTSTTTLKTDIEGLASAVTSGSGDVSAALTAQMTKVKASAAALATTATAVPAGSESDPEAAAVKAAADEFKASITTLEQSVTALEGKSGISKASALASVGSAAGDTLSKLSAAADVIKNAAKDGKSTLGQAFSAAPSCASLTS